MKRSRLTIAVAACVVAVGLSVAALRSYSQGASTTPYTATVLTTQYDQNGVLQYTMDSTVAVRGDGSGVVRRIVTTPDGEGHEQRTVTDPRARRRVEVDGITESLTTYAMTPRAADQYLVRPSNCGAKLGAPKLTIAGYEGVQVSRELQVPPAGGTIGLERWFATALNCLELKSVAHWPPGPDGQARLAKETVVTSVSIGEPDPAMFAIPASYRERPPSAVFAEFERRYPSVKRKGCEAPGCNDAGKVLDSAYYAQQPR